MTVNMLPLEFQAYPEDEMQRRAEAFYAEMRRRRSVRAFSTRAVPRDIIENCLRTAGTAPNGANLQPWHFVVVSDPSTKRRIHAAAEAEERAFYAGRAPQAWLDALAPLGTDASKPFLETAPFLIAIFAQLWLERQWGKDQALLRHRIGRHCHRLLDRSIASRRACDPDAHPQPDVISQRNPGTPRT